MERLLTHMGSIFKLFCGFTCEYQKITIKHERQTSPNYMKTCLIPQVHACPENWDLKLTYISRLFSNFNQFNRLVEHNN